MAGEAVTLTAIRRWLRNERGLPKEQVEVTGYWRRHEVVVDAAGDADLDATADEADRFHELTEIAPGFALRVAATIGLGAALGDRTRTLDDLAAATDSDVVGLGRLLRYLAALGVVTATAEGFALTPRGRELEDDDVREQLDLDGPQARREVAGLWALLGAVRSGGGRAGSAREDADALEARVADEAEAAAYVAGALDVVPLWGQVGTVAVHGRGAATVAPARSTVGWGQTLYVIAR